MDISFYSYNHTISLLLYLHYNRYLSSKQFTSLFSYFLVFPFTQLP
jgi:hypothetical protein